MTYVGLGTYRIDDPVNVVHAIHGMEANGEGYRSFDCSSHYKNEEIIGRGIQMALELEKGVRREDLFVTSKCWMTDVEDCEAACLRSLKSLGLSYIDLFLVHWPIAVRANQDGTFSKINIPMHKVWP
jgi:diketogulonate reductase-like aldo/keto reductase